MTAKLTKDELFLCTLAKCAKKDIEMDVDRYEVGQLIKQNNKSVDNTVQILVKTHFVKRSEGMRIRITEHGLRLVESLGF
jgi:Mn-dependent DtxR family transcriptional regulator